MTEEADVPRGRCRNPDCTVAETGICLEGYENYKTECPHYEASAELDASEAPPQSPKGTETETVAVQKHGRRFWAGSELGVEGAEKIMRARYTHLIGLIGPSDVGKTCFLIALYLKASSSDTPLVRYRFAGSNSLYGFEERARGARVWQKGQIPERLSERTVLQDPRRPGFMHLRLARIDDSRITHEVLLTDLPGEWFETVIDDAARADRLMFLRRADGILFFIDAERLLDPCAQHQEVQRARMLLGRLKETVKINVSMPFVLLISKTDSLEKEIDENLSIPAVDRIYTEAQRLGFNPSVVYTASFSRCPELIPSGYRIEEAFDTLLSARSEILEARREQKKPSGHLRSFARFRGSAGRFLGGTQ